MHSCLPFDRQYISQVTKWFAFKMLSLSFVMLGSKHIPCCHEEGERLG
jgi:hypothetical protein